MEGILKVPAEHLDKKTKEHSISVRVQRISKDYSRQKLAVFGILALGILVIAALAPILVPFDPYTEDLSIALLPPGGEHLLGTDRHGRDMLSRVLMGAQTSVYSALLLVFIITAVGTVIGMTSGYFGGRIDSVIMRISDVFLAFPGMVFAIAAASILPGGIMTAVIALACISWPKYARIARSQVLSIKNAPFMAAARLSGSGTFKMLGKHILPNIAGPIVVTAMLDIGTMMMEIAGLSFLGLGAAAPTAEWGSMMSNGRSMIQTAPWTILAPGCAIFLTVMIFNLLGDTIRDVMDPKSKERR